MFNLTLLFLILLLITSILMTIAFLISKKTFLDREKNSPFECGFDPKSSPRLPFSLQFFLIAVIFLIFDVEITLLIPLIFIMKTSSMMMFYLTSFFFFIVLILGTYHEWNQGALNWSN
uniref:NADH-ubiquinone oxidoreductase chain 3 n=1 Tax=Nargus velox TaxID=290668 RepID=A0A0S2M7S0_NARVE|nr:NADH deshydrogenase subunit 3 [Nargus velox]